MTSYTTLNKILHRQFLHKGEILKFSINRIMDKSRDFDLCKSNHIFITGLARAGTTALLQFLDSTNYYGSLRYKYMPFILLPKMAKFYSEFFISKEINEIERLHGDGLKISSQSPECLDEPFWINTKYKEDSSFDSFLKPHDISIDQAMGYSYLLERFKEIENRECLVIKNNNNHLRLFSLSNYLPNSKFIIVFRSPLAHSKSLLNLHKRLLKLQDNDEFIVEYMNMIGHWEFGQCKKTFIYNENQLNILKSLSPKNIDYWINQWIFTYGWLLEKISSKKNNIDNIYFLCYEDLCLNNEYKNKFYKSLGLSDNNNLFKFRLGKSNNENEYEGNSLNLINEANHIYKKLREL